MCYSFRFILASVFFSVSLAFPQTKTDLQQKWGKAEIGAHLSSHLFGTPLGINVDGFSHAKGVTYSFGTGIFGVYTLVDGLLSPGFHGSLGLWTGRENRHFEAKVGIIAFYWGGEFVDPQLLPLLTLGYRFQKPGGRNFYRLYLGTGGLGFGGGWILGVPNNPSLQSKVRHLNRYAPQRF